jgi:hypothetical protein
MILYDKGNDQAPKCYIQQVWGEIQETWHVLSIVQESRHDMQIAQVFQNTSKRR